MDSKLAKIDEEEEKEVTENLNIHKITNLLLGICSKAESLRIGIYGKGQIKIKRGNSQATNSLR